MSLLQTARRPSPRDDGRLGPDYLISSSANGYLYACPRWTAWKPRIEKITAAIQSRKLRKPIGMKNPMNEKATYPIRTVIWKFRAVFDSCATNALRSL